MKPYLHSQGSAAKYGGQPEEYLFLHDFMDSTKSACADVRHRAVLHSAFGIFIVEKVFGTTFTNSVGKKVSIRDLAEDHVKEDLGFIPSLETWVKGMKIEPWMMGKREAAKSKHIPMKTPETAQVQTPVTTMEDVTLDGQFKAKGLYCD